MKIDEERLVDAFSDCVGREKAREVITDVSRDASQVDGPPYDEDEAIEIAVRVANQADATPFVRTAANTLQTRIRAGNI